MKARQYQRACVANTLAAFESGKRTAVDVLPTGMGKTIIVCEMAKPFIEQGRRVMFMAHRDELIQQASEKFIRMCGIYPDVEKAEQYADQHWRAMQSEVIVTSVQTQARRMHRFAPDDFGILFVDECFTGDTLIEGRRIDSLSPGDETTFGTIRRVFVKPASVLVKIVTERGRRLVCTPNHLIFNGRDFVAAGSLTRGDTMATIMQHDIQNDVQELRDQVRGQQCEADLLQGLRNSFEVQAEDCGSESQMSCLRQGGRGPDSHAQGIQAEGARLLLAGMCGPIQRAGEFREHGEDQPEVQRRHRRPYEQSQPNERPGRAGQGGNEAAGDWPQAPAGRKREAAAHSAATVGVRSRMADGGRYQDWRRIQATSLQARHCQQRPDGGYRGGWALPRRTVQAGARQAQGCVFALERVDCVTIHQQGSGDGFERLCPDGLVYDLEIEPGHIYLANGFVVHNCHHATSPSYRKVMAYYQQNENLKVCGVTATPKRKDKSALGQVFECCPFEMYLLEAIESGWLVPLDQTVKYLESMDLSGIQVSKGDLNERQLNAVLEYEKTLLAMADEIYRHVGDRRCLVFCSSVAQAHRMCEILNRYETDCADFVCGETPVYNRRLMYQRFGQKEFRFLTNCNVLGEGFDDPGIEVVAMCKPTLSTLVYSQQLGRATRVLPGVVDDVDDDHQQHLGLEGAVLPAEVRKQRIAASAKPRAEILDFVGNAGKHSIVQAVDVLGGEYGSTIVDLARQEAQSTGKREDIMERLKRAKEKMERDAAEAERRKHILAKAKYENRKVDPFHAKAQVDAMVRGFRMHAGPPASDGQRKMLERHGRWRDGMSKGQAGAVISAMKNGPCSEKQAAVLRRAGMSTAFTMSGASKVIDVLAKSGWRWPPEHPMPQGDLR